MESNISAALELLLIGMITVFVVLLLVVATGNLLIRLVNRLSGEEKPPAPPSQGRPTVGDTDPKTIAALTAAVAAATQNQGHIESIKRKH